MSRLDYCKYQLVDDCYDWKNDNCDECNIFKAYCEGARRAKNLIVQCKDCVHQEECEHIVVLDIHVNEVQGHRIDSCSYGERRERND